MLHWICTKKMIVNDRFAILVVLSNLNIESGDEDGEKVELFDFVVG